MISFDEDMTHTYKKGEKKLTKVVMYYDNGTSETITDVEPTMVLVGWEQFLELKNERDQLANFIEKTILSNRGD